MAIQKLGRNRPLPRKTPQDVCRVEDTIDRAARSDRIEMAPPESARWGEFPVIAQEDVWNAISPYFSVVQWWLPEVEGSFIGHHNFVKLLGQGAYGRVYASAGEDGIMTAVKVISRSKILSTQAMQAITDECNYLSQLNHPNICSLKGTIQGVNNFYLFLEFAGETTLYEILYRSGPLDLRHTQHILLAILQAVDHMHGRGIAHCDLKPGNIVISKEGMPKIVDFGLASKIGENIGPRGTFPFVAPEALLEVGKASDLIKWDMWSLGVLLLEMLCGVGKFSRMLGWKENASMTRRRVMQLVSFLNTPKALQASIADHVGPAAEHFALVLNSMMNLQPQLRWDTKAALLTLLEAWTEGPN